ncbi:MAG: hypothetical protein Q9162_003110 [Coniocarpon cinnabarinum]
MASTTQPTVDPKMVSETAKQEGGTTAGSASAQLQSQMTKERNAQQVDEQLQSKMEHGAVPTQEEAKLAESREHRATGREPEPGSLASQAQSAADKHANMHDVADKVESKLHSDPSSITPGEASTLESREHRATGHRPEKDSLSAEAKRTVAHNETQAQREAQLQDAINVVAPKVANDPKHVTEEDANLLHSAERRAHGTVEKGGITAQAQHLAAENKGATK